MCEEKAQERDEREGEAAVEASQEHLAGIEAKLDVALGELGTLKDLFTRRLLEDKQKAALIADLESSANHACVEPFLQDLFLLLDRTQQAEGEFAVSVAEELLGILERRGVERICVTPRFDPDCMKAVRVAEDPRVGEVQVTGVVRDGYLKDGAVVRFAEVALVRPPSKAADDGAAQ